MTIAYPLQWPEGWARTSAKESGHGRFHRPTYGEWTFAEARDGLIAELERLGARNIVLSTNYELRRDGLPMSSGRRPDDHGIAVYFTFKGKQMAMACDRFTRAEHNMRSLSLAIEGMRQMHRHGGGVMLERAFAGFTALPPPLRWHQVLGLQPGATADQVNAAYRVLAAKHHPDRPDGSAARMAEINAARDAAMKELRPEQAREGAAG